MNAGITASNLYVSSGATFASLATFSSGLSSGSTITVNNAVQGLTNSNSLVLRTAVNSSNYITIGATGNNMTIAPGSGIMRVTTGYGSGSWATFGAQRAKLALQGNDNDALTFDVTIDPSSALSANRTLTCPDASGTIALTNSVVTSAVAGVGISVSGATGAVTISNRGVTSFNGSTGAITYYPPTATTGVTGMASFNSTYFSVSSGAVSLASAYQVTGDSVSAGVGIGVSRSTNSVTINNTGVTSFNGSTGAISFVNYVSSVNGSTGAITSIAVTGANTFTGLQTMNAGITANALYVSTGATFASNISAPNIVNSFNGATGAVLADAVTWSVIAADQTAVINRGYFTNKSTRLIVTLPTTAAVGSVLRVSGMTAGGWRIAQNAGEVIHFGKTDTTVGVTGYIESTLARDSVELICCVTDNEWNVVSSIGNITIV
jgi:hypothetical protein